MQFKYPLCVLHACLVYLPLSNNLNSLNTKYKGRYCEIGVSYSWRYTKTVWFDNNNFNHCRVFWVWQRAKVIKFTASYDWPVSPYLRKAAVRFRETSVTVISCTRYDKQKPVSTTGNIQLSQTTSTTSNLKMDQNLYHLIEITKIFFALWSYKCLAVRFDITFANA